MAFTHSRAFKALGTINSVTLDEPGFDEVLGRVERRVLELDDRLSVFKQDSEISRLNQNAGGAFQRLSPDTLTLLRAAKEFSALSGGAFSITCRPLVALWREAGRTGKPPKPEAIEQAVLLIGDESLQLTQDGARLARRGQAVDLGGIAKGYAADEAVRILREGGVRSAIVNFGGTVACLGKPRTVGVQHPRRPTGIPMGSVALENQALVTSGDYERFFVVNDVRCHHILDPRTGRSAETGLCSVTVRGGNAMALDALSTAMFVLGPKKGPALAKSCGMDAIFVTSSLDVYCSSDLRSSFHKLTN